MFWSYKWFLICRWYEKDIWGYITTKHKTANLGWIKVWPNTEDVPHLAKKKWILQDFAKQLNNSSVGILNFSFEIVRRMKKRRPKKMKNWMRFFFLAKILRMFYGNLKKQKFLNFCNLCINQKAWAIFSFLKMFEFWLPMFIYKTGLAPSLIAACNWVTKGFVYVNSKPMLNPWQSINLYDHIAFDPVIWNKITMNLVKIFFFAAKAARRRRCISTKLWSLNWIVWAHFISLPNSIYFDTKTYSLYWWKEVPPTLIKFYFSVNLSHILKYVTI